MDQPMVVNGCRIMKRDPIGHFTAPFFMVVYPGPLFKGEPVDTLRAFQNLADAIDFANRGEWALENHHHGSDEAS